MSDVIDSSIRVTIKKMLGLDPSYEAFDVDVTVAINSALMTLCQIGVGPSSGFYVSSDSETWKDFIGTRNDLEGVKEYVYLKTKIMFDPPSNSFTLNAFNERIKELEWRLNVQVENQKGEPDENN